MDAATLYIVLTMQDGTQRASIIGKPTWAACRQHIAFLQELKRMDPDAPIVRYRCMFKRPDHYVGLDICNQHHRQCEYYRTSTRRGCDALRWISHRGIAGRSVPATRASRERTHAGGAG